MIVTFDHLAISCTDLAAAHDWLEPLLGVGLWAGASIRSCTHNHLLSLGGSA